MQVIRRIGLGIETRGRQTDSEGDLLLRPGDKVSLVYHHHEEEERRHCLRIVGEVGTSWRERCEGEQPVFWYRSLEDALNREVVHNEDVSLHLKGRDEGFVRNAWFKPAAGEMRNDREPVEFSVWVKTRNLKIAAGGQVGAYLEIYHFKKGRHPDDVYDAPDRVVGLEVKPGTKEWAKLSRRVTDQKKIAAVLVRVGGVRFSGEAFFSSPCLLKTDGWNLIRPFNTPAPLHLHRNWLGENLSRKEWPEFLVKVNGQPIFRGPVFCCITRDPDAEFPIPESVLKKGKNTIEMTLEADYPSAPGYCLRRAEVLSEEAREFEVVAVPEYARAKTEVPVLIEINRVPTILETSAGGKHKFSKTGLHVLKFSAEDLEQGVRITDGGRSENISIKRAVEKQEDGVLLGTGDAVYVPQTLEAFKRYLKWYLAERIGNFITFRPVYRWCGSREISPEAWEFAVKLLNDMKMTYALMVDGRELPGKKVCPGNQMLAGPGYVGRQSHEADGAFYYWGSYAHEDPFFFEIFQRSNEPDGIFPGVRAVREKGRVFPFHATNLYSDMKAGSECFVKNFRHLAKTATRHTGPSALFRYMYQAGMKQLGAEQMYGPEDVILSALRGASRVYGKSGKKDFGAHLAVQWGSTPLAEKEHYWRYFLSLACCYLQGVYQINTEEGLYRMENAFAREDRFGEACRGHRETHTVFRRFLETHTRRGEMHVPIGILQGRYCGWKCFARGPAWDQEDPSMRFGPPEESFDLLKVFYPRCVFDGIYRGGCEHKPQGWYSGTPYGPVDLLPIEAPQKILNQYKVLAFLGWNTFNEKEFLHLWDFVNGGGTLLLARPHVSANIRRFEPSQIPNSPALRELLGSAIKANKRVERKVGKGTVIFYGQDVYPSEDAIRKAYEQDLKRLAGQVVRQEQSRGWIEGSEDVDFSIYDYGETRVAYLLNIAWWRPATAKAGLLLGSKAFEVKVPFGSIQVMTLAGDWAIQPENPDVDVMTARANPSGLTFTVQADGPSRFSLFHAGRSRALAITANGQPVAVKPVGNGIWSFTSEPGTIVIAL
jgi:hypothetical protein